MRTCREAGAVTVAIGFSKGSGRGRQAGGASTPPEPREPGTTGGGGVPQESPLAYAYGSARTIRLADGPDEVHLEAIAKFELRKNA